MMKSLSATSSSHVEQDSEQKVVWMGQFDDLLTGTSSFAIKLRTFYSEQVGSFDGASEISHEEDIADFIQWLFDFGGFEK